MRCERCGGLVMREYEHPEDPPVMKCQACNRVAGPPRPHEEPASGYSARMTFGGGTRCGTAMAYKEGCRCEPCTKAYRNAKYRQDKRSREREGAAA